MSNLHTRLVARQSLAELMRKALKALRPGMWTQEEIDYATRRAQETELLFIRPDGTTVRRSQDALHATPRPT